MATYMEELAAAFVSWFRHRDAVQDKVIRLIQKTDARFEDDEELRKSELRRLRADFCRVAIAERLLEKKDFSAASPEQLLRFANEILEKKCNVPHVRSRPKDMRTPEEERFYLGARVRWSGLLKKADVRAADNRGGDTSHLRGR